MAIVEAQGQGGGYSAAAETTELPPQADDQAGGDDYEAIQAEFLATLAVSEDDVKRMLEADQRYFDGRPHPDWIEARRNRLTASRFASACDKEGSRGCPEDCVTEMLKLPEADAGQAGRFGIRWERVAREAYVKQRRREIARGSCADEEEVAEAEHDKVEEVAIDLSSDDALNGQWHAGSGSLIIHSWTIHWPDDTQTELRRSGEDQISMVFHDETYEAELVVNAIHWSDGDIWRRVVDEEDEEESGNEEEVAIDDASENLTFEVREVGLCVWRDEPWLAASPDGLCCESGVPVGLLEVKTAKVWNDRFEADPPVDWMFQIQGCMHVASAAVGTRLLWCDLFCWSPRQTSCRRIAFDEDLWHKAMYPALRNFFFSMYVPKMVQKERCKRGRSEKMTNKHAARRAAKKVTKQ